MKETAALQLILPTDKRNPCFTLYLDEAQKEIHVYYGLELLEIVPNESEHSAYKLLAGRLYNAGVKVRDLEEVFGADRKTMRLWGQALRSRDPEQLQRVLLGRGVSRKRTPAVEGYVRHRWRQLEAEGCRDYRRKLQEEIQGIFGITLSGEAVRLILKEIKEKEAGRGPRESASSEGTPRSSEPEGSPVSPGPRGVPTGVVLEEVLDGEGHPGPGSKSGTMAEVVKQLNLEEKGCSSEGGLKQAGSKSSPPSWNPEPGQTRWCDHAGLLWFASGLGALAAVLQPPRPLLSQWLGSVLLGAINLEQTKYLNWDDLSLLLGSVVRFPTPQREQLQGLSTPTTVDAVLRWNLAHLGVEAGRDLYLDPHTKHYTGMQKLLKGWCPGIRWADKALHSDFVHAASGHPIYFECTDNFEDLRARFRPLVQRMRGSLGWGLDIVLTMVADRAIYSAAVFEDVLADPALHLITWQKGYEAQPWEPERVSGAFGLERCRNRSDDVLLYRFEYVDQQLPENPLLRQLIVRADNPEGRRVQVSILTDDRTRKAQEIIQLMFKRWVQENDFKYLDKHFGINQITSYRVIRYEELKDQLTDRQVESMAWREASEAGRELVRQQAKVLLVEERAQRAERLRKERIEVLEKQESSQIPSPIGELKRLRTASRRYEVYRQERGKKLDQLHEKLKANQVEKEAARAQVSRVDQLIEQGMVRLDTGAKRLMDAIKITARNLFYQALVPFKKAYDNYRDDHDYFRQLTLSAGVLRWTGQEVQVHLLPHVNYSPQLWKIIVTLTESLNEQTLVMPDGSGRKLSFRLTRREDITVRIQEIGPDVP